MELLTWLIIKGGVDIEASDNKGRNIVHLAALNGHLHILQWIITHMEETAGVVEAEKFIHTIDKEQNTALHFAAQRSHVEVMYNIEQNHHSLMY